MVIKICCVPETASGAGIGSGRGSPVVDRETGNRVVLSATAIERQLTDVTRADGTLRQLLRRASPA